MLSLATQTFHRHRRTNSRIRKSTEEILFIRSDSNHFDFSALSYNKFRSTNFRRGHRSGAAEKHGKCHSLSTGPSSGDL